jgi:acetylornithine/N-succinyldiaminopimelate aminotransferase
MKLFDVYPLMPVTPVSAQGCFVTDKNGQKYLDFYGGHAVISIGHNHPHYNKMITAQLGKIAFYSNAVINPLQEELAFRFGKISGCEDYQLFLCNSGAEANENALKLASFHNSRKKIVAFYESFHGRTSAAVAATYDQKIITPLNDQHQVEFIPLNDFDRAEDVIDDTVCAVIIEGIQGVAGVIEPSDKFLRHLEKICRKNGALLILDEVQSGCGRTGNYFAYQSSGIKPDVITVAKGIGNGFPIGAVMIAPHIKAKHGMLGTTFGGSYLACAAALSVIDVMEKEKQMMNNRSLGQKLIEKLQSVEGITKITGRGLMIGVHFNQPIAPLRKHLLIEHRIFTGTASDPNIIRLLPPYCITEKEVKQVANAISEVPSLNPV